MSTQQPNRAREREEEDAGTAVSHHCHQPPTPQRRQSRSMAVAAMDVNDTVPRQCRQRGGQNNQIKVTVVKMALDCSGVDGEDGVRLQRQRVTTRRKQQSTNK